MKEQATEEYWSRFPDTYDRNQEYVVGREVLDAMRSELSCLTGLGETLELGCGTGCFTESVVQKTDHVTATDLSDSLLEVARQRLGNNPKVSIRKEDCANTSFGAQSFDSVFMANLIHVVEEPLKVLEECHRVLRDGGMLIIVTFTSYGMGLLRKIKLGIRFLRAWGKPPKHMQIFSPEKLALLMEKAGFTIMESKLIGSRMKAVFLIGKKSGST